MHRGFVKQRRPISGEGFLQFLETVLPITKLMLLYWVAVAGGLLFPGTLWSQTLALEPVLSGLTSPLYVTNAHDGSGRLFILEQEGRIKVLQPGATTPTLFLDLTSRVLVGLHTQVVKRMFCNFYGKEHRGMKWISLGADGRGSTPSSDGG